MLANFRHGLGLLLLGLALGASHLALSLLPTSLYSPPSPLTQRQRNLLNRRFLLGTGQQQNRDWLGMRDRERLSLRRAVRRGEDRD